MSYKLIEEFKSIIGEDPVFSLQAPLSPLFMIVTWHEKVHPLHIFCITKDRTTYLALNEKEYIAIALDKFRHYFNQETSIKELEQGYFSFEKNVQALYDEFTDKNLADLSDTDLQNYAKKVNELFLAMANETLYIENVDYEKILSVIGPAHKATLDTIWKQAIENVFISFEGRRLKKLLEVVTGNSLNKIRKAKFIFTDYFWTKSDSDISSALEDISQNLPEKEKEYEDLRISSEEKMRKQLLWLETLDTDSRSIAQFAQLVMHMRDLRKDPIAQMQTMFAELSVVMLERAGVDIKIAPLVLMHEYMKGVTYLSENKNEIEQRSNGCIFLTYPDYSYKTEHCDIHIATQELTQFIEHKVEKTDSIKGQIACKGNVKGIARVILDPHENKGFQQGDILVTSMTRPEFVPLMKKAGAVITNEGGITCHAAIISRELNIPCIIGTKVATQLIKDGDTLEVDANTGVVKII